MGKTLEVGKWYVITGGAFGSVQVLSTDRPNKDCPIIVMDEVGSVFFLWMTGEAQSKIWRIAKDSEGNFIEHKEKDKGEYFLVVYRSTYGTISHTVSDTIKEAEEDIQYYSDEEVIAKKKITWTEGEFEF